MRGRRGGPAKSAFRAAKGSPLVATCGRHRGRRSHPVGSLGTSGSRLARIARHLDHGAFYRAMAKPDRTTDTQYGALPYRITAHGVEVMLV
jgi:hypothetical protein